MIERALPYLFRPLMLALACLCAHSILRGKDSANFIEGRVVGVHDGDTITLLTEDKEQVKVRLEGIDAPELKQAFGNAAKQELSGMIFGKDVKIKTKGHDRYKRTIGRIYCVEKEGVETDVNLEMVKRGYAWRYDKYSKEPALLAAQREAQEQKRGLWAGETPVPPWEWRKK